MPERHAQFLKAGDAIRHRRRGASATGARSGTIQLVYPQMQDGRVGADATVDGLGDYFVGERLRVWVSGGERPAFVVPAARYVVTRFGVDYGALPPRMDRARDAGAARRRRVPAAGHADGLEILSGVKAGDRLVKP